MQRCDDCNSNVDGERVLCVGCADARAVPPAPMPDLAAAIKQAEESLALFDSPCTPLPHEVYQDRAMDALRLILAAAKATSAPEPSNLRPSVEEFRAASAAWGDCHCEEADCDHITRMRIAAAEISYTMLDWLDGKPDYHDQRGALRRCEVKP